jgi:CheY-like chemotaxis protein
VIDDNLDAANAMAMLVAALGGEARVAVDGPAGIEQVIAWEPDLVLLDIGMPGMDGYETCRLLRQACGTSVCIVALTGWGQEQDKREAAGAGFDAHLTKPADPAAVEQLLAATPARRR